MASTDEKTAQPVISDKEYVDIIKSDTVVSTEFIEGTGTPAKIVYYCQDCEKIVAPKRLGKKLSFSCDECKGGKVSFGREESILNHYRIKKGIKPEI